MTKGRSFLCAFSFSVLEHLVCLYIQLLRDSCLVPFVPGSLSKQEMLSKFEYSIQCKFRNKPHASKGGYR